MVANVSWVSPWRVRRWLSSMIRYVKCDLGGSTTGCRWSAVSNECLIRPPTRRSPWSSMAEVRLRSKLQAAVLPRRRSRVPGGRPGIKPPGATYPWLAPTPPALASHQIRATAQSGPKRGMCVTAKSRRWREADAAVKKTAISLALAMSRKSGISGTLLREVLGPKLTRIRWPLVGFLEKEIKMLPPQLVGQQLS